MTRRTAVVAAAVGLHARPAAALAEAAAALAPLTITLSDASGRAADAASILSVLALGVPHGAVVTIETEGDGADVALDHLVALIETDSI